MPDTPVAKLFDTSSLTNAKKGLRLSLEFFPPKTDLLGQELLTNAEQIATHLLPDFVSITYGAGGGTRNLTFAYSQVLRERFGWTVMPHLTCVGHTREELLAIAESYHRMGIRNIMALRGDPPKGVANFIPVKDGFAHANDLVKLLKTELPEICLGVAGYPEKHPEAPTMEADIANLKTKVDAGGDFVTTQLFFDNAAYVDFVKKCRAVGITKPILPGLMPLLSLVQAKKISAMCGTPLPVKLEEKLNAVTTADQWKVGVEWTLQQIEELIKIGVPGIHLYILNRSQSVLALLGKLRERGIL